MCFWQFSNEGNVKKANFQQCHCDIINISKNYEVVGIVENKIFI